VGFYENDLQNGVGRMKLANGDVVGVFVCVCVCDREGVEVVVCSRADIIKSVYYTNTPIYQCMCIVCKHV